jgi:hypothetical protein
MRNVEEYQDHKESKDGDFQEDCKETKDDNRETKEEDHQAKETKSHY